VGVARKVCARIVNDPVMEGRSRGRKSWGMQSICSVAKGSKFGGL